MSAPPQRPLDIGRALDLALLIYRRHFVSLAVAMAVAVVPLGLLTLAPRPWGLIGVFLQTVVLAGVTPGVATLVVSDVRDRRRSDGDDRLAAAGADARRARALGGPSP